MAIQAMWVHGHSAQIELNEQRRGTGEDIAGIAGSAIVGRRMGWGVQFACQDYSDYWFHFAIPTPVIADGVRARFRRAMLLFESPLHVTLAGIHVWDGPNRIFRRDDLAVGGVNRSLVNDKNSFSLPQNEVFWGVGISVRFHFSDPGIVTLHTAGVDFDS